jgi:hypothetical protein
MCSKEILNLEKDFKLNAFLQVIQLTLLFLGLNLLKNLAFCHLYRLIILEKFLNFGLSWIVAINIKSHHHFFHFLLIFLSKSKSYSKNCLADSIIYHPYPILSIFKFLFYHLGTFYFKLILIFLN